MKRESALEQIKETDRWDVLVIGGGATGAGIALDAASRGYSTLLLEKYDFGKATSSRSTKLIHGGVRYLQQGNLSLVIEALKERGILHANAPHLVKNLRFVVPTYNWWESPFYGLGLKLYDTMAGRYGFGDSELLNVEETLALIPTLETDGLRGGVIYYDGQFDDSRLLINILQTAVEQGAYVANYFEVTGFIKSNSLVIGVTAKDNETDEEYEINSTVVINAAGVFVDELRNADDPSSGPIIEPSRGTHIVLDKSFLPGDTAMMIPHTDDGRILFAIPWHDKVIVGTTDIEVDKPEIEPQPDRDEIDFLLEHAARYLTKDPSYADILSAFAGLRPLVKSGHIEDSASISREHSITISGSGLISVAGGKWTTYRKMAEDVVDKAIPLGDLPHEDCKTAEIKIHGFTTDNSDYDYFGMYGSDAEDVKIICNENNLYDLLHPDLPFHKGEVIWAVRKEMARSVEDFLSRRTRSLLLNARASIQMAEEVAKLMDRELGKDDNWIKEEVEKFTALAKGYLAE